MTADTARRIGAHRRIPLASILGLLVLSGCGTSLLGSTSSTGGTSTSVGTTATTVPVDGEVTVAFPVVACGNPAAGTGTARSRSGWVPSILVAPIPTSLVGRVTFYTDGMHTLLGPTGWTCSLVTPGPPSSFGSASNGGTAPAAAAIGQSRAIDAPGATTLAVYPPGDPSPPVTGAPAPGAEGIFATYGSTGNSAGIDLVCSLFALATWQPQSAGCTTTKPTGEASDVVTPDVTEVTDPDGVVGNLAASGGEGVVTGVVIFPQIPSAVSYGSPVDVDAESCSITTTSLCRTILSDFEVREFPVPTGG